MKDQKALKTEEETFKIEEIVAVTSGRGMKDVNSPRIREKLYEALKNSTEYKYDEEKSLPENIYAAFPQYKLKELTTEYNTKMNSWKDLSLTLFNPTLLLRFKAEHLMIPDQLTIKVKKSNEDPRQKPKPYPKGKMEKGGLSYESMFG